VRTADQIIRRVSTPKFAFPRSPAAVRWSGEMKRRTRDFDRRIFRAVPREIFGAGRGISFPRPYRRRSKFRRHFLGGGGARTREGGRERGGEERYYYICVRVVRVVCVRIYIYIYIYISFFFSRFKFFHRHCKRGRASSSSSSLRLLPPSPPPPIPHRSHVRVSARYTGCVESERARRPAVN